MRQTRNEMLRKPDYGFTLVEILIVVFILGITAIVVVPNLSPTDSKKLDQAANEVAQAIRFVRSEAIRTGQIHAITISQTTQKITTYKADLTTTTLGQEYILTHPIDKKSYENTINTLALTSGVVISNTLDPFLYPTTGRHKSLAFDANGTPIWIILSSNTTYPLQDGMVQLSYADDQRVVRVAPMTGRVTIE